jgi:hypothetical protein
VGPHDLHPFHIDELADLIGRPSGDHRDRFDSADEACHHRRDLREDPRQLRSRDDRRERPVEIEEHAGPRRPGADRHRNLRRLHHAATLPCATAT